MNPKIRLLTVQFESFYEHCQTLSKGRLEIYFTEGAWKYRANPYKGDWAIIEDPTLIEELDINDFLNKVDERLLTKYAVEKKESKNPLFLRQMERLFDKEILWAAEESLDSFFFNVKSALASFFKV